MTYYFKVLTNVIGVDGDDIHFKVVDNQPPPNNDLHVNWVNGDVLQEKSKPKPVGAQDNKILWLGEKYCNDNKIPTGGRDRTKDPPGLAAPTPPDGWFLVKDLQIGQLNVSFLNGVTLDLLDENLALPRSVRVSDDFKITMAISKKGKKALGIAGKLDPYVEDGEGAAGSASSGSDRARVRELLRAIANMFE